MLAFIDSFNKIGSYTNVLEAKIPESWNPGVMESRIFLVRYRRTLVITF